MREIKFRAWDVQNKCWIPKEKFLIAPDGTLWTEDTSDGTQRFIPELPENEGGIEYKLSQFTGLHDKNGKDIFEGDIVRGNEKHTCDLRCRPKCKIKVLTMEVPEITRASWWIYSGFQSPDRDIEIIGNIYENPELLNDAGKV